MSSHTENPGVVTGHAKLVEGKAQELAGYTEAGQANIQAGKEELKAYSEQNPPSSEGGSTVGNIEKNLGSAVGCEGLEQGGQKKID